MNNGQNVARSRHLEELARAAKRYTLQEIFDVTEALATELGGLSLANHDDFTGATSITGGLSGLVPAPQAGDESKFLRGDGSWSTVPSGGVEVVSGGSVGILDTVPATVDGGLWYEKTGSVPVLWLHKGNYDYGYVNEKIRFAGDTDNGLVAYLPFNVSPTNDVCGNAWWTATGNPTIVRDTNSFHGKALYLDGSSYLQYNDIESLLGTSAWTLDFWATVHDTGSDRMFFGAFNVNYGSDGRGTNYWVVLNWKSGRVELGCYNNDHLLDLGLKPNQRYHYATTYDGTNLCVFVDGQRKLVLPHDIKLGAVFCIGCAPIHEYNFKGTIDHFRIHRKVLWTSDFTPPTANNY